MLCSKYLGFVIVLATAFFAISAQAQHCLDTVETQITCDGPGGCHHDFVVDHCTTGSNGGYCTTGYGTCCGSNYSSSSASGTCSWAPTRASGSQQPNGGKTASSIQKVELRSNSRQSVDLYARMFFVPDQCRKSYGIVGPDELQKIRGGD